MSALAPQHPLPPQQQFQPAESRRPSVFRKFVGRLRSGSIAKLIPDDCDAQEDDSHISRNNRGRGGGGDGPPGLDGLVLDGGIVNHSNDGPWSSSPLPAHSSEPLVAPEPAVRARKRGSITHSAAAWTAKMRGAGIGGVGNGAPNGRRESSAAAAAAAPPSGPAAIAHDLWSSAYNALRDGGATARLTSTYESIVSHDVPKYLKLGGNASLSGQSDHERAELFSAAAKAGAQKRRASKTGFEDDDDDDNTARDMLASSKSAVESLLPNFPVAGLAWAGLCIMTPVSPPSRVPFQGALPG